MNIATQLLCTFTTEETLEATLQKIADTYDIVFGSIYVLENTDVPNSLCLTYNIDTKSEVFGTVPESTISLHRKKSTNTLYTINALNLLVAELNNGDADSKFVVPWNNYKNTILVTAYSKLKKIPTKLKEIVKLENIQ